MIECYGCGNRMHNPWSAYEPEFGEHYYYCLHCEFWRRVKRIDPGNHKGGPRNSFNPITARL